MEIYTQQTYFMNLMKYKLSLNNICQNMNDKANALSLLH